MAHITQNLPAKLTYQDADLKTQRHSSEITEEAIQRVKKIFREYLDPEHNEIDRWFGMYISDPKSEHTQEPEESLESISELIELVENGDILNRHPASRFAYIKNNSNSSLFIDGNEYPVSTGFAESLCEHRKIEIGLINLADKAEQNLLVNLYNAGSIYTT